jgi:putative oxidoreductase
MSSLLTTWSGWAPYIKSLLRIVAAAIFITSGTTKMFGVPSGMPGGGSPPVLSQIWIGAWLEMIGGALLLIGLLTRPVAFVLAGEMAVAYFQFHAPGSFWPTVNQGIPAILYCWIWLYYSAAGPGPWSVDARLGRA